jgi:hypothetical protein
VPGFEDPWDVVSGYALRARSDNSIIINVAKVSWLVDFHPACEVWANNLEQADAEALLAAVRVLRDQGPSLGRPLVDTVKGSRHSNMKEFATGIHRTD